MNSVSDLTVLQHTTILNVLEAINRNGRGICFVVDDSSRLEGVVTDGDIRRHLMQGRSLTLPVSSLMNTNFIYADYRTPESQIRKLFSPDLRLIPLVNDELQIIDVADAYQSHRVPVLAPYLGGNELEYVIECIESTWISSNGAFITKFEDSFAKYHGIPSALAVSSGTTALHLALKTLNIGPGDEVIIPNLTFAATANAVIYCGATPVLCDVDPTSWCIDVSILPNLVSQRTKAIIPVHLYGQSCDMEKILLIASKYNLLIVEDCAEALGTRYKDRAVGTFGDASIFSFFGNKTISTGEGGMILFKDMEHLRHAKVLRDHGMSPSKRYWHDYVGFNYRLTNLQAALGCAQMENLSEILRRKQFIHEYYSDHLKDCPGISQLPHVMPHTYHSNWLYTLILQNSVCVSRLRDQLLAKGIETRPVFYPLHVMPPYSEFRRSSALSTSIHLSNHGLSLPSAANLSVADLEYVTKSLCSLLTTIQEVDA